MKFSIKTIPTFSRELKLLARKYHSLRTEFEELLDELEVNPHSGTPIGKDCYKIRLVISSKGKGKSGGARVITCVRVIRNTVYLLAIFDKSDFDNIEEKDLISRLNELPE
jgi:mRNA-degrading endonuclease RelE of RelBE toxin-antitoxin system